MVLVGWALLKLSLTNLQWYCCSSLRDYLPMRPSTSRSLPTWLVVLHPFCINPWILAISESPTLEALMLEQPPELLCLTTTFHTSSQNCSPSTALRISALQLLMINYAPSAMLWKLSWTFSPHAAFCRKRQRLSAFDVCFHILMRSRERKKWDLEGYARVVAPPDRSLGQAEHFSTSCGPWSCAGLAGNSVTGEKCLFLCPVPWRHPSSRCCR